MNGPMARQRRRASAIERPGGRAAAAAFSFLAAVLLAGAARADRIEQRGGGEPLVGTVLSVTEEGVNFRTQSGGTLMVVPLDKVAGLQIDRAGVSYDEQLALADMLWRARSRLQRGDERLAEPLFDRLFQRYRGQTNETALIVAEGLLRCRLARGETAGAIIPALETARLRRAEISTLRFLTLPVVFDETSALCMYAPPVWIVDRRLEQLRHDLAAYDAQGDEVVAAQARLYDRAAALALGEAVPAKDTLPHHAGLDLLDEMIDCVDTDEDLRQRGRTRIERRLESAPAWTSAWIHFALGRSLLLETGRGRRTRGLLHLAHLPARAAATQPFLTGLAMAAMARAFEDDGDADRAQALRAEIRRQWADHPALRETSAHGAPDERDSQ